MPSVLKVRKKARKKTKRKSRKKTKRNTKTKRKAKRKHYKVKVRRTMTYKGKKYHQTGKSVYAKDVKRRARRPTKRRSKSGKIYYEYRRNRSDLPTRRV